MSINSRMKSYNVYQAPTTQDTWGDPTGPETLVTVIQCSISTTQGTNISRELNYTEVTHLGLTTATGLKKSYILRSGSEHYVIDKPPVESTRLVQLYLKEVV